MSIYDNLADSAYLEQDQFRKQLQLNSQLHQNNQRLDYHTSDSGKVNQDEEFSDNFLPKDEFTGSGKTNELGQSNFDGGDSRLNYLLQSQLPLPRDTKLAKEDLFSKRHAISDDIDDDPFEKRADTEIIQQPSSSTRPSQINNGRLTFLPPSHKDHIGIDQFKHNNDQLQQILMQLQAPAAAPQHRPSNSHMIQKPPIVLTKSGYNESDGNYQIHPSSYSRGSGPNHQKLNKDNSILEIAKMQNSNGSNSDTYQTHSIIDKDFFQPNFNHMLPSKDGSPVTRSNYPNTTNYDYLNPPSMLLNSGSVAAYQFGQQSQYQQQHLRQMRADSAAMQQQQKQHQQQVIPSKPYPQYVYVDHKPQAVAATQVSHYAKTMKDQDQTAFMPQQQQIMHNKTGYYRDMNDQEQKRRELMDKFDDIPIKELNKADGYQQNITQDTPTEEDTDDNNLSITQRIEHTQWKVRVKAYKEVSEQFYIQYSKDCQSKNFDSNPLNGSEEEEVNAFDQFTPFLQKIISDSNLVAQYEGLNCLYTFVRYSQDIKQVTFMVHVILLEKIQHNKPNLREITNKILLTMIKRDKTQSVLAPELFRRFKNKNIKIAIFSMETVVLALRSGLLSDEATLRQIFKSVQDQVSHTNKEMKDTAIELIKEIYKLTADDASAYIRNLKSLRPIQLKEIKDILSEIDKTSVSIHLFAKDSANNVSGEGQTPKKQKNVKSNLQDQLLSNREKNVESQELPENESGEEEPLDVDLLSLIPENFNEIPYISQINSKKRGMEAFNSELEKLSLRKQLPHIQNKDYTLIYNVVTHMLEDSNALVFMEGIKTVELLTILMGKQLKQQKMKAFIALLADKYKETKTASVQAVNKSLQTIFRKQVIPLPQMVDYLVCQLAHSNKNPRVKQLILERVDLTLIEEQTQPLRALKEDDLVSIFKVIKDKIIGLIQKDTNAAVRDAAVSILITFKAFLNDSTIVNDTINTLPKYRVQEINKFASERIKVEVPQKPSSSQAAGGSSRPNSAKEDMLPVHKKDIFTQLNRLAQTDIVHVNAQVLSAQIDEAIELLGEEGVQSNKAAIVATVHSMLLLSRINFYDNLPVVETLLVLLKQIFCIERSVMRDPASGQSRELDQAIEVALFGSLMLDVKKQPEALLNVLLSAASPASEFFEALIRSVLVFSQQDNCVALLEFVFKWVSVKADSLMKRGVSHSDFEELRNAGLQFINDRVDQAVKTQIIQILIQFKTFIQGKRKIAVEEPSVSSEQGKPSNTTDQSFSINNQALQQQPPQILANPQYKPLGQHIVETLEADFEKGLLMIKQLADNLQGFDFGSRELVFNKLLAIVTTMNKSPQQQYQQAYGLKALLWMREEIYGVEDSFKFTAHCMSVYAQAYLDGRDYSVEIYLLNYWVKDFSIRDLIDRVSSSSSLDERYFNPLFSWLMTSKLNASNDEKWTIEDFRKLALPLAKNIKSDQVVEFFTIVVEKFGRAKIRDFMEIQLMHNQNQYNNFVAWFQIKFRDESAGIDEDLAKIPKLKLPPAEEVKGRPSSKYEDIELRDALGTNPSQASETVQSSSRPGLMDHSKLYKHLREQRKYNKHTDEDLQNDHKYDQIISRLEAQLQQKSIQEDDVDQSVATASRPNTRSDQNKRYQSVQEEDLPKPSNKSNGLPIQSTSLNYSNNEEEDLQVAEKRLHESSLKENVYRNKIDALEEEKRRLDEERDMLLKVKNHETREWQQKYQEMVSNHDDVVKNLNDANQSYLKQVGENESLRDQLKAMQQQQQQMMDKFREFEDKLIDKKTKSVALKKQPQVSVVTEESLEVIRKTFNQELTVNASNTVTVIQKVQELLLNFTEEKKLTEEEIGEPLYMYYQSMRTQDQKKSLIKALHQSLDKSEDVLFALPHHSYKALLAFNLKIFAQEKAKLEEKSIRSSVQGSGKGQGEQNEITIEVQKIVSKLLNSKEFTTSLVTLFEILRSIMPPDLNVDLSGYDKQHLKVILRCISRINKALPSEHPDLIRAFDVLIEMQKIFMTNPPESLREDLPCLEDFDLVYRGLKDVADKMMELQPEKVKVFLKFVAESTERKKNENAFVKYMRQVMGMNKPQDESRYDEDDYEY